MQCTGLRFVAQILALLLCVIQMTAQTIDIKRNR